MFLKESIKKSLKLSPYDPNQKLRLIIDGSRTIGTGFILVQYINDDDVKEGIKIVKAGSSLLPQDREFIYFVCVLFYFLTIGVQGISNFRFD